MIIKKFALLIKLALIEPPIALGVALLVEGIVLPSIEAWAKECCMTSQGDIAINASKNAASTSIYADSNFLP